VVGAGLGAHPVAQRAGHVHGAVPFVAAQAAPQVLVQMSLVGGLVVLPILVGAVPRGEGGGQHVLKRGDRARSGGQGEPLVDVLGLAQRRFEDPGAAGVPGGAVGLDPLEPVVALGVRGEHPNSADDRDRRLLARAHREIRGV
jgi:hypothetical protein